MDFGIALPTPADSWKTVKRAEDAGFSTAWFYDTQVLSADIFVAMGAAAVKTDRIRLGTGVLIPSNRIAPVAANGLATLNALAPGRIDAGFGTGYTGRRSMGLGPYKISDMDEYIRVITAMWRGEKPDLRIEGKTQARPDGPDRHVEDRRGVLVAHPFESDQKNYLAVLFRKLRKRVIQLAQLTRSRRIGRRGE